MLVELELELLDVVVVLELVEEVEVLLVELELELEEVVEVLVVVNWTYRQSPS